MTTTTPDILDGDLVTTELANKTKLTGRVHAISEDGTTAAVWIKQHDKFPAGYMKMLPAKSLVRVV